MRPGGIGAVLGSTGWLGRVGGTAVLRRVCVFHYLLYVLMFLHNCVFRVAAFVVFETPRIAGRSFSPKRERHLFNKVKPFICLRSDVL